jgi:predicted DNA-binding protein YlxM (UPF0122 family)
MSRRAGRLSVPMLLLFISLWHRLPVVLFYFQDLSYREIAEALELPIGTVMSRLARARQQLHELMKAPTKLVLMKKAESL